MTIPQHLVRRPASDPAHKIGNLFVKFGGLGVAAAPGVLALGKNLCPPSVLARYDLVGVDPRGTGRVGRYAAWPRWRSSGRCRMPPRRVEPPGYFTDCDAGTAITCGDTASPADLLRYWRVARTRDASTPPCVASRWAFGALPCAVWRGRPTERYTGPWTRRTPRPVLIVNTTADPATPYRNAVRVHRLLPNSALLTVDGAGHGALIYSSCAMDAAARYLLTGTTPRPGIVCRQDNPPFAAAVSHTTASSATPLARLERPSIWEGDR